MEATLIFPSYFPNLATFAAISQYKVHWEVSGNYQKQSLRNRTYIVNDRGLHPLTVPVTGKGKGVRRTYSEVLIDNSQSWQRTHWRTLQTAYRTSPYFEFYEHELAPIFSESHLHILSLNLKVIQVLCKCLQLPFSEIYTPVYQKLPQGIKDHRYLIYPKPPQGFKPPKYNQVFMDRHGFVAHLSVLDLLFNEGPNTVNILRNTPV